ncbi:zinc-finger of the MIZ type in Nse subunit-domain-containing protein [Phaeosphaeria sp. MPI-PUGE-AT-0046c]|nr:zinc-finger of the MIZ type in Nse subunit-domain-containing protein [Phaeosphaeria sp. MPI-PUGE-AT-0046c]
MSHRIRSSNARPTASRPSAVATPNRNATDELPAYRKPSHPLDSDAARQLRELQGRSLNDVKRHNKAALEAITATAASVNDMLREHSEYIERRQKKWDAGKSLDDKADEERAMQELQEHVEGATAKLEESMRALIDSGVGAQRIDDTLDWLRQYAPRQLEEEFQTQMTQRATQRQSHVDSQRRLARDADGDEDMSEAEEMDDGPTPGPTPLDGTRITLTGVSELFADRQQRQKDSYTSLSLTARYARNNEYRDFKRIVHDAKYGDAGPTLGHEDTWFTETGSPAPGITNAQRGAFDDDDDIIVDKATISTRCPITFQQFKEPYTSIKCPHTFERNAIVDMIRNSANTVANVGPRGGGLKAVSCPVTGCDQNLTLNDLRSDPILIRKIKRMQQAEAAEAEESSDDEAVQAPRAGTRQLNDVKSTPAVSSRPQALSLQQLPQSSMIEDLGEPSDDGEPSQQAPPMSSMVEDLGDPSESEDEL